MSSRLELMNRKAALAGLQRVEDQILLKGEGGDMTIKSSRPRAKKNNQTKTPFTKSRRS